MLSPEEVSALPRGLVELYGELSDFLLEDVSRRIARAGKITATAEFQLQRMQGLAELQDEISKQTKRVNTAAERELERILSEAAEKSDAFDKAALGVKSVAGAFEQLALAQSGRVMGELLNITGTTGFAELVGGKVKFTPLTEMYLKQCDLAHLKIASGALDYNTAIRQAIRPLAESGVRTIHYASGRSNRLDVAVRRAVMTGTGQITQRISEENAGRFGADGWEISAHAGARPSHAEFQGRQFPNSQYRSIVEPLITDYNCRHSAFPIIMGVTQPMYTAEELRNIDPPPFTFEGKTYSAYEATQQQRKMERAMRLQKDRLIAANAAGLEEDFTAGSVRLARQKKAYAEFSRAAGLPRQMERTAVYGFGRSLGARAAFVAKKVNTAKVLTKSRKEGILKGKSGEMMKILPKADKAIIPEAKMTAYALNPFNAKDKARVFESALGYNLNNADKLIENIKNNLQNFEAKPKGDKGYGELYEVLMSLVGENGKTANVLTAWIDDKKTGEMRLVSVYVKSKKGVISDD